MEKNFWVSYILQIYSELDLYRSLKGDSWRYFEEMEYNLKPQSDSKDAKYIECKKFTKSYRRANFINNFISDEMMNALCEFDIREKYTFKDLIKCIKVSHSI